MPRGLSEPSPTVFGMAEPYEIRASARRRRSMSASREAGRIVVVVPASMTLRQRRDLVPALVERFLAQETRRGAPRGEAELTERVRSLYRTYLLPQVGGEVPPLGVRWVSNQQRRWGSCTPATAELRALVTSGGSILLSVLQPSVADGARMPERNVESR